VYPAGVVVESVFAERHGQFERSRAVQVDFQELIEEPLPFPRWQQLVGRNTRPERTRTQDMIHL
jgi:hypothetical protein